MRMELLGSGSGPAVPPPPPQHQSSSAVATPAAPTLDTSPAKAWADAVAQATANSPQQHVVVKPGDTLTGIADHHNATLPGVEKANPQITDPNLIYPRQTVYLPKVTPAEVVTGVHNTQIKPIITAMANANLADQGLHSPVLAHDPGAVGEAQAQSTQSWDAVKQTTLKMLTDNNHSPYPEEAAAAEVRQLNALEPGNAKFAAANNAALAQATQQWKQMGVTKSQLSPIINAYNTAKQTTNSANQYLQNPHMPHNRAIVDDLMGSEQQANAQLNTAIERSLADAANGAGKDPKARSAAMTDRAANIQLVGPQDPAFQTAVDNANYDLQVNKPAQAVANAYTKGGAQAAAAALNTATQDTSNSYYAGQIIQQSQGTIENIARDLGSIASNEPMPAGGRAGALDPTPETGDPKFNQIYGDLSQSVAAANTITINRHSGGLSVLLSQSGKAAADMVGTAIAANAPKNLMPWQSAPYGIAATNAIAGGDGAALTVATAAALKRQGNSDLASVVTEGATSGIQALQSKTSSDVAAFATTTTTLHQLRATWGPFMTESQLAKATNGYLADHPDVRQKADAQLATISQDGDMVAEAESAWNSYRGQLNGIGGQEDLSAAAKSLTGNDASTAFAVSQSPRMNSAIAAALGPSLPSQGSGGSVVQALIASPVWSFPRSARSALNNTYKWLDSRNKAIAEQTQSAASPRYGTGTYLALSGIGLGLTGLSAWSTWGSGSGASSPQQLASSAYTALGFGKYTGEVVSGFAKYDIVQKFLGNHPGFSLVPDKNGNMALSLDLPNGSKVDLANLTKAGWFKGLGSAYYGAGALANFLQAADDFSNGDYAGGSFDVIGGIGNALNAAKPLIPGLMGEVDAEGAATATGVAAADAVAALGSGLGLIAAAGTVIWLGIKSAINANHYQEDGSKFLQRGLGLNSNLADWLALPGQSTSASAALNAYAHAYGLSPREQPGLLLSKLNNEPLDKTIEFINEAAGMPTQPGGGYAASMPGDGPNKVGTHSVTMLGDKGHNWTESVANQADSLRQLNYWADYLFGKNQLG